MITTGVLAKRASQICGIHYLQPIGVEWALSSSNSSHLMILRHLEVERLPKRMLSVYCGRGATLLPLHFSC